jgi:DNA polymerase V
MAENDIKGSVQQIGPSLFKIPYYPTSVPAGFPSPAADYVEDSIDLNELLVKTPSATFLVRVEGESMVNAFIPAKALLIVDRSITPSSGDIIVAVLNGEFTVKRFIRASNHVYLASANVKFDSIEITEEMNFIAWGVVSKIIIDPKEVSNVRIGRL